MQSSSRDIDTFRLQFFQCLIHDETTKAAQLRKKQRMCFHAFEPVGRVQESTVSTALTAWECRRCGLTRTR